MVTKHRNLKMHGTHTKPFQDPSLHSVSRFSWEKEAEQSFEDNDEEQEEENLVVVDDDDDTNDAVSAERSESEEAVDSDD